MNRIGWCDTTINPMEIPIFQKDNIRDISPVGDYQQFNLSESGDFWVEVVSESPMGAFSWNAGQGRWMP